jgi:hypothetical protein
MTGLRATISRDEAERAHLRTPFGCASPRAETAESWTGLP